jgi:hypothetical protein
MITVQKIDHISLILITLEVTFTNAEVVPFVADSLEAGGLPGYPEVFLTAAMLS